jgi:hypothetical protein
VYSKLEDKSFCTILNFFKNGILICWSYSHVINFCKIIYLLSKQAQRSLENYFN